MFRGGFAWLNAVQNMSGERQWKRKDIESIPEYWREMSRSSPGKRESLDSLTTCEISSTRSCRYLSTSVFDKMRNFAGLLKPVVFTIKQVGRQVLFLLNNKRLIKNKYQTRNCSLQTVNYKWSWENIQCVKDFPAVLLALYKRGRAILF